MYGPSFLQLVNKVLVRLREPAVNSVSDNSYSQLIGAFVNQAKREVEDAWRWQDLRTTYVTPTVDGTITYRFTDTDGRAQMLDIWDATSNAKLCYATWERMNAWYFGQSAVERGAPKYWTPNGQTSDDGSYKIDVYPVPDGVYTLQVNMYAPQRELVNDGDRMYCPQFPVVEGALAKALQERGEDGGQSSLSQFQLYAQTLSDAIAVDANQHPTDLIWRAV